MNIANFVMEAHGIAEDHGFWDGDQPPNIPEKLALIHSELSEALECMRDGIPLDRPYRDNKTGKPEGFAVELADAVIRIADLCGYLGIDLEYAIELKMSYNRTRPHKHGKVF
jgi:NTP pyrophosphatase (non-canonical NTP hydrolase)